MKIVLIGDAMAGKTSFLEMFIKQTTDLRIDKGPTYVDNMEFTFEINRELMHIDFWDTGGIADLDSYRKVAYNNTDSFLVCFSVEYTKNIEEWLNEIKDYRENSLVFLVGLRTDLRSYLCDRNIKTISKKEGLELAKKFNFDGYCECSAKSYEDVSMAFNYILTQTSRKKEILERYKELSRVRKMKKDKMKKKKQIENLKNPLKAKNLLKLTEIDRLLDNLEMSNLNIQIKNLENDNKKIKETLGIVLKELSQEKEKNQKLIQRNVQLENDIKFSEAQGTMVLFWKGQSNELFKEVNALKLENQEQHQKIKRLKRKHRHDKISLSQRNNHPSLEISNCINCIHIQDETNVLFSDNLPNISCDHIFSQKELEKYKLKKVLSENQTTKVLKVSKEKSYSVRLLNINVGNEENFDMDSIQKLLQEYEILSQIKHKNIQKVYGVCYGDDNNLPSILLKYQKRNLFSAINDLNFQEKLHVILDVCEGMSFIHSRRIIHRDLNPENIFLDSHYKAVIGNFGKATLNDDLSHHTCFALHFYLSPEQLNENTYYDEKVDVYSFGMILYFILTEGKLPEVSLKDVMIGKEVSVPDKISLFSREIILRCLAFDPALRPTFKDLHTLIFLNSDKLFHYE
ncbi:hypothetical protein TRFO_19669 [Tritrichomonas foetus]|uniref:Protein kinase domain-containing protein n=1 Tax=Tritrichomonas foetus TaxID=1144522 RepID=A0A1J4KMG1_9EUKA|nr:hypothetical protein TRFO_19669 [Tritrichomonas foetus]|eukprot:OHT10878.1 hypothetical protein TRFO_19669 [Tritrichomonas foetus]